MADTVHLQVVTPERIVVDEQVESVQIPASNGYLGVLPGHAPLLAELGTGFLHYTYGNRRWYLAVSGGFIEVLPDRTRVLANMAQKADEIDVERARQALEKAQEELGNPALGVDPAVALEAIQWAEARLEAARHR